MMQCAVPLCVQQSPCPPSASRKCARYTRKIYKPRHGINRSGSEMRSTFFPVWGVANSDFQGKKIPLKPKRIQS